MVVKTLNMIRVAVEMKEHMIQTCFKAIEGTEIDGAKVPLPTSIPWYPNDLAWHFSCPRSMLRRSEELAMFQRFLMAQTDDGNISRQEAVSMIPPMFMDAKPGQTILDMCAAPGSKTAQLIEAVTPVDDSLPQGLVIANDADYKRAKMLVHQSKRLNSPCIIVTNHDAQRFPSLTVDEQGEKTKLEFDRILCDVPCR